jgi:uncharacterized protein YbjT (DUF2867 family)
MSNNSAGRSRPVDGKVLVTGAGGYVASLLVPHLAERHDLRLVDVSDITSGYGVPDVHVADMATEDQDQLAPLFEGVDTVVHLGYIRSSPGGLYDSSVPHLERFEAEFRNVRMAYNVYRSALEAGVRRVVVASSNHAADWYEHALIHQNKAEMVTPEDLPLSDNFYGWSKASYELLGYPFACGTFGRALEIVMIRIGSPYEVDAAELMQTESEVPLESGPRVPAGVAGLKRYLAVFFNDTATTEIYTRAIEAPDILNEHGIPWLVVYGISGNTRAFWSLQSARTVLGFEPIDDSEVRYASDVGRWLTAPDAAAGGGRVGP